MIAVLLMTIVWGCMAGVGYFLDKMLRNDASHVLCAMFAIVTIVPCVAFLVFMTLVVIAAVLTKSII